MFRVLLIIMLLLLAGNVQARGVYQTPEDFLAESFPAGVPAPSVLWIKGELKDEVQAIMGHRWGGLRLRYWGQPGRTAWIVEEIGKEKPITVGIVIQDHAIERIHVLEFRESRGWEVRHGFFTDQFGGARMTDERELSQTIDGISGATLSVRALRKLARVALFLHQQTAFADEPS